MSVIIDTTNSSEDYPGFKVGDPINGYTVLGDPPLFKEKNGAVVNSLHFPDGYSQTHLPAGGGRIYGSDNTLPQSSPVAGVLTLKKDKRVNYAFLNSNVSSIVWPILSDPLCRSMDFFLAIKQDATGGRTVNFAGILNTGDLSLALQANALTVLHILNLDGFAVVLKNTKFIY